MYNWFMNIQGLLVLIAALLSFGTTLILIFSGGSLLSLGSIASFCSGLCALSAFFLYIKSSHAEKKNLTMKSKADPHLDDMHSFAFSMSTLSSIIKNSTNEIQQIISYPLFNQMFSAESPEELQSVLTLAHDRLERAETVLSILADRVLTDCIVLLPLADAIIKAVPIKTEEAAFGLMEKFMVVREASERAESSARSLQAEIEDTASIKSITYTAENSRKAVQAERESILALSQGTRENREHLQSMSREIDAGLGLLNNITEITEQSKLIAFNMSIEAARMGEKGRGVKVITTELHKLNDRTFNFSRQVAELLGRFRDFNTLLVTNMEEKSAVVVSEVEKGIDATEEALESLIGAASHADNFTREIAVMAENINQGLDGVLESLQFQDITRQMIEGSQSILRDLKKSLDECLVEHDIPIDEKIKNERFNTTKQRLIAVAKTKGEKNALMEVQL